MPAEKQIIDFSNLLNGDLKSRNEIEIKTKNKDITCIISTGKPNFAKGYKIKYHKKGCPSVLADLNISIKFKSLTIHQA